MYIYIYIYVYIYIYMVLRHSGSRDLISSSALRALARPLHVAFVLCPTYGHHAMDCPKQVEVSESRGP